MTLLFLPRGQLLLTERFLRARRGAKRFMCYPSDALHLLVATLTLVLILKKVPDIREVIRAASSTVKEQRVPTGRGQESGAVLRRALAPGKSPEHGQRPFVLTQWHRASPLCHLGLTVPQAQGFVQQGRPEGDFLQAF